MVETKKCRLAKFLDNIIKPYISDTYLLKSTEHFLNKVKKFNLIKNEVMLVLMLCLCLHINVPLSEAVELMIDRLHSPKNEAKPPKKK